MSEKSKEHIRRGENPFNKPVYIEENYWKASLEWWDVMQEQLDDDELPTFGELWALLEAYSHGYKHASERK